MEPSIYSFSLYTALPLMLFFGFYFLFAKTPEKKIFKNYLRSRQIMGIAMLLLSANYSVHFFFGIRFKNADSAILMNMYRIICRKQQHSYTHNLSGAEIILENFLFRSLCKQKIKAEE